MVLASSHFVRWRRQERLPQHLLCQLIDLEDGNHTPEQTLFTEWENHPSLCSLLGHWLLLTLEYNSGRTKTTVEKSPIKYYNQAWEHLIFCERLEHVIIQTKENKKRVEKVYLPLFADLSLLFFKAQLLFCCFLKLCILQHDVSKFILLLNSIHNPQPTWSHRWRRAACSLSLRLG